MSHYYVRPLPEDWQPAALSMAAPSAEAEALAAVEFGSMPKNAYTAVCSSLGEERGLLFYVLFRLAEDHGLNAAEMAAGFGQPSRLWWEIVKSCLPDRVTLATLRQSIAHRAMTHANIRQMLSRGMRRLEAAVG